MRTDLIARSRPGRGTRRDASAVWSLFATFLGYNPMRTLLGPTLHAIPASQAASITGKTFFPSLISGPFIHASGSRSARRRSCA